MKNYNIYAYLRDDPYKRGSVVNDSSFWGEKQNTKIYLDYHCIPNRSIITTEGLRGTRNINTYINDRCDQWIDNNLVQAKSNKLFVLQGYAGCGKTIFINSLYRKNKDIYRIDITDNFYYENEQQLIFEELLCFLDDILEKIEKDEVNRTKIFEKLCSLRRVNNLKDFNIITSNSIPPIMDYLGDEWHDKFTIQLHNYFSRTYGEKEDINSKRHNRGQIGALLSFIISLLAAQNIVCKQTNIYHTIIFDNLDIISDPAISAEFVYTTWNVLQKYDDFCKLNNKLNLPKIKIIITVRKVLFSHIASHLPELEMNNPPLDDYLSVCDISGLYLSKNIIMHRIEYWKNHCSDPHLNQQLELIQHIISATNDDSPDTIDINKIEPVNMINLDAFSNHNYRAFSAVLSIFINEDRFVNIFNYSSNHKEKWQIVADMVFSLSLLYRNIDGQNVWGAMGFGCENYGSIDYPTTLNRLILNYLYFYRTKSVIDNDKMSANFDVVSLKSLLDIFGKMKFINIPQESALTAEEYDDAPLNTQKLLLQRLAEMCARNPYRKEPYGYDINDLELWRRPLYFRGGVKLNHTAAGTSDLYNCFEKAQKDGKSNSIFFSITDEGCILLKNFVINFEFYSARCVSDNTNSKPLYQSTTPQEIDNTIAPVYELLKKCCDRNILFMKTYMNIYDIKDINMYLSLYFHPRTNIRFVKDNSNQIKQPRPQLHIIRVLYSHIGYFDSVKNHLYNSTLNKVEKINMCKRITNWIKLYLDLYNDYFYPIIENTSDQSDNHVFCNLLYWCNKQIEANNNKSNVNIRIRNESPEV